MENNSQEPKPFIPFWEDVTLDTRIWFGRKHKGKLLYQIILEDTGYVSWMMQTIERFHLNLEAFDFLIETENENMKRHLPRLENARFIKALALIDQGEQKWITELESRFHLTDEQQTHLNSRKPEGREA